MGNRGHGDRLCCGHPRPANRRRGRCVSVLPYRRLRIDVSGESRLGCEDVALPFASRPALRHRSRDRSSAGRPANAVSRSASTLGFHIRVHCPSAQTPGVCQSMPMPGAFMIVTGIPLLALVFAAPDGRRILKSRFGKSAYWVAAGVLPIVALWNVVTYQIIWHSTRAFASLCCRSGFAGGWHQVVSSTRSREPSCSYWRCR